MLLLLPFQLCCCLDSICLSPVRLLPSPVLCCLLCFDVSMLPSCLMLLFCCNCCFAPAVLLVVLLLLFAVFDVPMLPSCCLLFGVVCVFDCVEKFAKSKLYCEIYDYRFMASRASESEE